MPLNALDFSKTQVSELSPLKDLKLTHLSFRDTPVSDLTPLKDMMLIGLNCSLTKVSDLSPLKDMPLTGLAIEGTQVSDLSPIRGMQLTNLVMEGNHVADLSPLRDMPLKTLTLDFKPFRDTELLRSIKTLETIQNKPAAEFWKDVEEQQSGNENAAITVISPDAIRMHKLEVDQPRLYDANPPRRIEGVIEELEGWQFISIPQRITNSYEIRVNRAGIIYAFGGGPKQTAAETFGKEVAQWEPAVGAIKGKNVNLCFRRKVIAGELITLKAFELQLAAESIAIKK